MTPAKDVEQIEMLHRHPLRDATDFFLVDEDFFMRTPDELREFTALYKQRIGIPFERPISNASVLQAARLISWHREVVAAYFLINGNPYEEQEDLLQTLQLMAQLPQPYYAQIFNLVFFPGTTALLRPGVIRWTEPRPFVSRFLVAVKTSILSFRRVAGALLKRIMADPAGVYNLPRYLRNLVVRRLPGVSA